MDYRGHAHVAAKQGALRCLAISAQQLCGQAGNGAMSTLYRRVLLEVLSAVVGAFGLSPARLPQDDLDAVLDIWKIIFEGAHSSRGG
jgi:hypothetical protein